MELCIDFQSLEDWLQYRDENPSVVDQALFDERGEAILRDGCVEPLTRVEIEGSSFERGSSWREGLTCKGVNSRTRAVMLEIERIIDEQHLSSPRIYAAEALTPFALRMRGLFPRFLGSEFTQTQEQREWMYPIPFEDLQRLSLPSDSFDIVSTNEVLEHVPSYDRALSELCRVLRPGGWHVGTVPFSFMSDASIRRALIDPSGDLVHVLPPEYHGDPMDPAGVLVFEIPGWDIIDRAQLAGFSYVSMRFIISMEFGIMAEHAGGVFVLCCQK